VPTIFSHAIAATAVGQGWRRRLPRRFWMWTAMCAMLPDVDVIAFSFGIPYDAMLGHRGITHSMAFAALVGAVAAWRPPTPDAQPATPNRLSLFLWFSAVTASHGLLDALTNGGRGIAFFAPFSGDRYFFPWRPIQVSPIGVGFFSPRGLRALASEAVWIWVPSAIIAASARVLAHLPRPHRGRPSLLRELRRAGGRKARAADGSLQDRP